MMTFNRVMLIGMVTKISEIRTIYDRVRALKLRLVTAKNIKAKTGVASTSRFITPIGVDVYGKNAEWCEKRFPLREFVYVEWWLKEDRWISKDGQEKFELVVTCERIQALGPKIGNGGQGMPPEVEAMD